MIKKNRLLEQLGLVDKNVSGAVPLLFTCIILAVNEDAPIMIAIPTIQITNKIGNRNGFDTHCLYTLSYSSPSSYML